jgi:formamidopyrimidine-DNA glycosylase
MPELPEVESTVRYLQERIEGRTIIDAFVNWHRTIATHSPQSFKSSVISSEIRRVFRRGKFIGMELCGKKSLFLFIHLRMSGSLDVIATKNPHATHDRAVLNLNNNKSVRFNDTRKFGRIYLCDDPDVVVGGLGIEPLSEKFTPLFLHSLLKKRAARIKPLLLNQNIIAGLGNIYVDEALWRAKIHPRAEARKVSMRRCRLAW